MKKKLIKVFFRTDASLKIGHGHVIRCLTLAKALRKLGVECKFICRDYKNNLIKRIKNEGFDVNKIPNLIHEDVNQTINILEKEKIDWLVIDHYKIGKDWEKKLRLYSKKIMVIDDLANRKHDCDLLLDQNLILNYKTRYQNLINKNCKTLLGPQYALLQPEYLKLHKTLSTRTGLVNRILVFFGGSDQFNITELAILSFLKLKNNSIKLDVVISLKSPYISKIKIIAKKNKNIKVYNLISSLAPLMIKADLAIGACGSTSWERCCLGLPSIVITVAENQKPIARELHRRGLIKWLGHYNNVGEDLIFSSLNSIIKKNIRIWSKKCKLVTNGLGVKKVTSFMLKDKLE